MRDAALKGLLLAEQTIKESLQANEVNPSWPADEPILVQGIIDAYFEEDGKLILVDYKTDRVSPSDGAAVLIDRYAIQLRTYARALDTLLDLSVSEIFIYSLSMQQAIPL